MLDNLNESLMVYLREPSIFVFLIAFLGGLLTSFTPCVYPVIPVTVAVVGMRSSGSGLSGFLHAVVYVTGKKRRAFRKSINFPIRPSSIARAK